jgi:hypothetical protein
VLETNIPSGAVGTTAQLSKRSTGDISARVAGLGALAFVAIVALQNVVRGASAPSNGASTDEVLTHYADHRAVTFILVATFVLSGIGLALFLGGAMKRLTTSDRRAWAFTGYVGAICVMALFAVVVGAEQALSVIASGSEPHPGAIDAIWALHNSVFTVLYVSIAVALTGLSRAGAAAGITPRAYERLAPVGSALLAVAAIAGPSIAAGDAMGVFALGGLGFLIWLSFLLTTGLRLLRSEAVR